MNTQELMHNQMLAESPETKSYLDIYGLVIECKTTSMNLMPELLRPFVFFVASESELVPRTTRIVIEEIDPPYETFPSLPAAFSTPRNIVYQDRDQKIIDYFGKGVVVQSERDSHFHIYGSDRNFLVEAFYLLVLSLLGQHCDRQGLLRIHALAMSYNDLAVLMLMSQGGGKSTMARALIEELEFRYISDDDPILDQHGRILPFPRPIGVLNRELIEEIPEQYVYKVNRMEFGWKYYIDCEYWKDKTETRKLTESILLVGRRVLNGAPSIVKYSKMKTFGVLIRDAVIGVGLYQGLEFLLSHSSWDALSKIPVVFRRFLRALRLIRTTRTYQFTLSGCSGENLQVLKEFLTKYSIAQTK
ncbi:hypothetical protein L0156_24645 [bacterium]|nr:hypothetical protein [bacterium]